MGVGRGGERCESRDAKRLDVGEGGLVLAWLGFARKGSRRDAGNDGRDARATQGFDAVRVISSVRKKSRHRIQNYRTIKK